MRLPLAVLALALALALPVAAGGATTKTVKAPKSGSEYGKVKPYDIVLQVQGKSISIVAFNFPCGSKGITGRTSMNDFRLKRTSKGYRFNADAHAAVTYSDELQDENATTHISGRFTRDAKTVRGHLRVKSKRCGDTGNLDWKASKR
jgi:hypothetical protein